MILNLIFINRNSNFFFFFKYFILFLIPFNHMGQLEKWRNKKKKIVAVFVLDLVSCLAVCVCGGLSEPSVDLTSLFSLWGQRLDSFFPVNGFLGPLLSSTSSSSVFLP